GSYAVLISVRFFFLVFGFLPTSTLFPYTTLFRSDLVHLRVRPGRPALPLRGVRVGGGARDRLLPPVGVAGGPLRPGAGRKPLLRDRKSTRLNSSHDQISYAVFCLKKKNHEDTTTC